MKIIDAIITLNILLLFPAALSYASEPVSQENNHQQKKKCRVVLQDSNKKHTYKKFTHEKCSVAWDTCQRHRENISIARDEYQSPLKCLIKQKKKPTLEHFRVKQTVKTKEAAFRFVELNQTTIENMRGGKKAYFVKGLKKKREDHSFSNYTKMPPLRSKVAPFTNTRQPRESAIILGMLPNQTIINEVRKQYSQSHHLSADNQHRKRDSRIFQIHMVQDYEFEKALEDLKAENIKLILNEKHTALRRFDIRAPEEGNKIYYTYTSRQFRAQDRRMLPPSLLQAATIAGIKALEQGHMLYIHCKGGRERSATVVIAIRVIKMIRVAQANKQIITKSAIDNLIKEQIAIVKTARKEVTISIKNINSLQIVAYQAARLIR